jgi:hypothetical protein
MGKERKKIPKIIKEAVFSRQKGKCVCCMERGCHYHHLLAYSILEMNDVNNVFLLCKKHHLLFHLGDPETYQAIYEYAWYIHFLKLPEEKDLAEISKEVMEILNEKYYGKTYLHRSE